MGRRRGVDEANVFRELEGTSVDCHQGTGQLFVKKNNFFGQSLVFLPQFLVASVLYNRIDVSSHGTITMFCPENVFHQKCPLLMDQLPSFAKTNIMDYHGLSISTLTNHKKKSSDLIDLANSFTICVGFSRPLCYPQSFFGPALDVRYQSIFDYALHSLTHPVQCRYKQAVQYVFVKTTSSKHLIRDWC